MKEVLSLTADDLVPERDHVLRLQEIPPAADLPDRVNRLLESARGTFAELARPVSVIGEISIDDFRSVYRGDGNNDLESPLAEIFPQAERLALFAATLGEALSVEIDRRFERGDLAEAVLLDAAASAAAERLVELLELRYAATAAARSQPAVLAYSPGYCGWHVSGQRALFSDLDPVETGIVLNDSCLMHPLKSVSGVLVAGRPEIHDFDDNFPCCSLCSTRECRQRIDRVRR